ncbi:MAG TPA: hypothetical protein ENJ41_05410 [Oceanospirillales bacterium]|nr:hypothetical protein [Oceanospirillales bacterium]
MTGTNSSLIKSGSRILKLNAQNTFTGSSTVNDGELLLDGTYAASIAVTGAAIIRGSAIINAPVSVFDSATIAPGEDTSLGTGTLTVGDFFLDSNTTLEIRISDRTGIVKNSQIVVNGIPELHGNLTARSTHDFLIGESFTIIDNQSNNPISGMLNQVAEGGIINNHFQITYQGGDGNDVVITSVCADLLTVTNSADSGPGSLRQSVLDICANGIIDFDAPDFIELSSAIQVNKRLSIIGSGQILTGVNNAVFEISAEGFMVIDQMTIQNTISDTGAIINYGFLFADNMYFANNNNFSPGEGGAITNYGDFGIKRSSFYQNNATQGGAILHKNGSFSLSNSTLFQNGNIISNSGASIYIEASFSIDNVTIVDSGNGSGSPGNSMYLTGKNTFLQINNTLISNSNLSASECLTANGATITTYPNSTVYFVNDGSCNAPMSGDPVIGLWGMHGGFTPTIPLLHNSPLIDAGENIYCTGVFGPTDQIGNNRISGPACDIGAVEFFDDTIFTTGFE